MFAISVSYKNSKIDVREKLAVNPAIIFEGLKKRGVNSAVFLSTCNRIEVYGCGNMLEQVVDFFSEIDRNFKSYVFLYENEKAIKHLFYVASGLDSMVIGEDEILGQVKKAYYYSLNLGFTDYELNSVFQAAISVAKRIKNDTLISKSSVSVATLVANYCHSIEGIKKIVLIGGSGEIGNKILKNLISFDCFEIYATVREKRIKEKVNIIDYNLRYDYINNADIIISATGSPHFTILGENLFFEKKQIFIDLASPRDIDFNISEQECLTLLTIDDFEKITKKNQQIIISESFIAKEIIEEETEKLQKEMIFHSIIGIVEKFDKSTKNFIYELRDKSDINQLKSMVEIIRNSEMA